MMDVHDLERRTRGEGKEEVDKREIGDGERRERVRAKDKRRGSRSTRRVLLACRRVTEEQSEELAETRLRKSDT